MAQPNEQGPCILVLGIILIALGFYFWVVFLMAVGGFLFILGLCLISQQSKRTTTPATFQPGAQPVPQLVAQPAPQPAAHPAPAPITETARFCPNCGAKTTGSYCSECGSEID